MAKKKKDGSGTSGATGFTDTKRVKELIELMTGNGLTEIELVEDKSRIVLRRGTTSGAAVMAAPLPVGGHVHVAAPVAPAAAAAPAAKAAEENLIAIKSPMVGTYYAAPNPDSDPYVSVGAEVQKDKTVVCVIEAMKVFNEIHADATGSIAKILVSNGQAVEYGQTLFLVRPA